MGAKITILDISLNTKCFIPARVCAEAMSLLQKYQDKMYIHHMEPEDDSQNHCSANEFDTQCSSIVRQ
jgi:hypothetical protein